MNRVDSNIILIVVFHFIVAGLLIYVGMEGQNKKREKPLGKGWYDTLLMIGLVALIYNMRKLIKHLW